MKILLATLPFTAADRYGKGLGLASPELAPLGVAYLAACLREAGHELRILDAPAEHMDARDIAKFLTENKFGLVGFSAMTPMYSRLKETMEYVSKSIGDASLLLGGPHPSILPKETMEDFEQVDYVVVGEGEHTIVELAQAVEGKRPVGSVKGIGYREDGEIILTEPRPFIEDLDTLPFPARDLLPMEKYEPAPSTYRHKPVVHMITTRGCPFNCIYCSKAVFGRVHRHHSAKRVVDEMEHVIQEYGAKEIFFLDDIFTLDKKWAEDTCNEIIDRGLSKKIEWSCSSRVNTVSLESLKKMRQAGCWQIHYGIESGVQRLLDLIRKGITLEQSRNAVKWSKEAGIQTRAYFMVGLPTETLEDTQQTIEFAKEIDPDYVKFSLTTPYPGTELFDMAIRNGELKNTSWETFKTMGGFTEDERPYTPAGRSGEELKSAHRRAFKEFYLRPKIIFRELTRIRTWSEIEMNIRGALALVLSG